MYATENDIETMQKLQEVDRAVALAQKEFDALLYPQQILDVRQKRAEVLKKKVQVQDLLDKAEDSLASLVTEEEALSEKQKEVEAKLEEVKGDYRSVESFTRELNGVIKRRDKLALNLEKVEEQVTQINPVMKRIMVGCDALDAQEEKLSTLYKEQGGTLRNRIVSGQKLRESLAAALEPATLKAYEAAAKRGGGVALAHLHNDSCSACRSKIEQGRLLAIKGEAPLSQCPACGRLLIVDM